MDQLFDVEEEYNRARRAQKILLELPPEAKNPLFELLRGNAGILPFDDSRDPELAWMLVTVCDHHLVVTNRDP